jgi:HAAS domain-containing protein
MKRSGDDHVEAYLNRLEAELADLPRGRRRELVGEIRTHIEEAQAQLAADDEAGFLTVFERLGDPAEIAAEAGSRGKRARGRVGGRELLTVVLLLVGGVLVPLVGWIVGVVLLWASEVWTRREKVLGTLVIPGGLLLPVGIVLAAAAAGLFKGYQTCTDQSMLVCSSPVTTEEHALWMVPTAALVVALFVTAAYLLRRARRIQAD